MRVFLLLSSFDRHKPRLLIVSSFVVAGFIAVRVVDILLKEGFKVVGTVRSAEKGDYLVDLFGLDLATRSLRTSRR